MSVPSELQTEGYLTIDPVDRPVQWGEARAFG
jgi:hypothetical protein